MQFYGFILLPPPGPVLYHDSGVKRAQAEKCQNIFEVLEPRNSDISSRMEVLKPESYLGFRL